MKTRLNIVMVVALLALVLAFGPAPDVRAQEGVCTVTSDLDDGSAGTLRALLADTACSTVDFDGHHAIRLGSTLTVGRDVTIDGGTHDVVLGGDTDGDTTGDVQILVVNSGVAVTLKNLTLEKGSAGANGGAVYSQGTLTVEGCTFSGNRAAADGGAIYNAGSLTVSGSTFSGNSSSGNWGGGAICSWTLRSVQVTNSTFSGNSTTGYGGALFLQSTYSSASATLTNNTFAANTGGAIVVWETADMGLTFNNNLIATGGDAVACDLSGPGHYPQGSNNLTDDGWCVYGGSAGSLGTVVDSLLLATLGDYGGNTETIPLLPGSPAIDAGGDSVCPEADQRGVTRPQDGDGNGTATCDVGAYELEYYAQPALDALSPASAVAGSTDLTLTVSGSGFVSGSTVRWNGENLATAYHSATQLTAVVPAANLAGVQTAQVSVYTPAPGGGASSVLAFFVTESGAGVTDQDVASGTSPSASVDMASAAATGDGLLVVAEYDANPGGTPSFTASGSYFDVYAAPDNTFTEVTITACGLAASDKLFWWDAVQDKWVKASPQSNADGCITLTVNDSSSPTLSQLQGTYFVAGSENAAPVADPGGPYLGAIGTLIAFDGSGSSDPENDPLAYAWDFGDGSTGSGAAPAHTYTAARIYDVCLTINDGALSDTACTIAVVYDPSAGFVTGGGWIDSPAGAYTPDPNLSGKATFGFVSKYKKGAQVPTGTTQFQFGVAGFDFYSETYEWLVVNKSGTMAQFKGSGTVNGGLDPNGNAYKFMIWAGDGAPDTLCIRIWWEDAAANENVVYDNGFNQAIGAGNVVVHK